MSFLKNFIKKNISRQTLRYFQNRIHDHELSIISNDCWGGEIYKHLQMPYLTPFVGLMIMAPCYVKLLKRPLYYLEQSRMEFITVSQYETHNNFSKHENYPLACIDDIEIHFLHYKTPEEAQSKWSRRVKRINWDKIYVKFEMGKDYATPGLLDQFLQLPFDRKIVLGPPTLIPENKSNFVAISNYSGDGTLNFYSSIKHFDIVRWLNSGEVFGLEKFGKLKGEALSRGLGIARSN